MLAKFVNCIRNCYKKIFACVQMDNSLQFAFGVLDQHFIFHTKEHAISQLEAALCLLNLARTMLWYLAGNKT